MKVRRSFLGMLLIPVLLVHSVQAMASMPTLQANYKSFRGLVNTFNHYTRISKRPLTDQEWAAFKATMRKIGITGIVLVAALVLKKYMVRQLTSNASSSPHVGTSAAHAVNLRSLTDEEFRNLDIDIQWKHVGTTGNWKRLKEIINRPVARPFHAVIRGAENHNEDIVPALRQLIERYPSKINELDQKNEVTPVWQAVYKLQNAETQSEANRLAEAITYLIDQGAKIDDREKLRPGITKEGTLQEAIESAFRTMPDNRIDTTTMEIQEMKQEIDNKFKGFQHEEQKN